MIGMHGWAAIGYMVVVIWVYYRAAIQLIRHRDRLHGIDRLCAPGS